MAKKRQSATNDRLLLTAKLMLIALAVFFFAASLVQLGYLHDQIGKRPRTGAEEVINGRLDRLDKSHWSVAILELESRVALEEYALNRRYHQANVLLMSRVWINYLSFVTGMILSFVGASFILGRIREPATRIDTDTSIAKMTISSSSPGIILATLGSLLIATSILTNHRIQVEDRPVYLAGPGLNDKLMEQIPSNHSEHLSVGSDDLQTLDKMLE